MMPVDHSRRPASHNKRASLRVGLLRHGEVEGGGRFLGHTDSPLTAAGQSQMYAAITDNDHWARVISSPLSRCAEFAHDFAHRRSLPLSFDPRLKEMHFGAWEGRSAAELMETDAETLGRFWADPAHNPPPGGEPLAQFQARVLDAWYDILADRPGRSVLVVTHGGVIRMLLCHVQGVPLARWHEFEVKHGQLHGVRIDSDGVAIPASESIVRV